jgi:hypothetical protein
MNGRVSSSGACHIHSSFRSVNSVAIDIIHRCRYSSYIAVCRLLGENSIFISTGRRPQIPVHMQVALFLRHCSRTNAHHLDGAREIGVGSGTTYLCLDRVSSALRDLRHEYIRWPTGSRRIDIKAAFQDVGFPGAIGAVDGMLVQLAQTPPKDGMYYYCRKKFYGVNVQATVDHDGYFTSYDIGWPASQNDITIFKKSTIWRQRDRYFHEGDYLLADKGMLTSYLCSFVAINYLYRLQNHAFHDTAF